MDENQKQFQPNRPKQQASDYNPPDLRQQLIQDTARQVAAGADWDTINSQFTDQQKRRLIEEGHDVSVKASASERQFIDRVEGAARQMQIKEQENAKKAAAQGEQTRFAKQQTSEAETPQEKLSHDPVQNNDCRGDETDRFAKVFNRQPQQQSGELKESALDRHLQRQNAEQEKLEPGWKNNAVEVLGRDRERNPHLVNPSQQKKPDTGRDR